jgi:transposase
MNALQARRFAQSKGSRIKTDAVDARMLAQMGAALELVPQVPTSETMRELKELQVARQALVKDRTRLSNRIKTQKVGLVVKRGRARLALPASP